MPDRPLDDEFDRQTFYRGHDPEADAEDDYELEPPDAEVIAGEKRRADEAVQHASKAVDLDELYREETSVTAQDIEEYLKDFRFQFGTKHLLMAMTAVAMLFVLGRFVFGGFAPLLLVLTFTVLASIYGWFSWHEHKRRQEWERKREELYRRHQQRHDKRIDTNHEQAAADDDWGSVNRLASIDAHDHPLVAWDAAAASLPVRLQFSTMDMLTVATLLCTSIVATMLWGLPGATLACGVLLLSGILWHLFLASPPPGLASGLWVLVVFYVGLNLLTLLVG